MVNKGGIMRKTIILALILLSLAAPAHAETTKFNPFTGKPDYVGLAENGDGSQLTGITAKQVGAVDGVSIFQFIPQSYHAGITARTDTHDLSAYFIAAAASNRTVTIPAGRYYIGSAVTIAGRIDRFSFVGDGAAEITRTTDAPVFVFGTYTGPGAFNYSTEVQYRNGLHNLRFSSVAGTNTTPAVEVRGVQHGSFTDLDTGTLVRGVDVYPVTAWCTFDNIRATPGSVESVIKVIGLANAFNDNSTGNQYSHIYGPGITKAALWFTGKNFGDILISGVQATGPAAPGNNAKGAVWLESTGTVYRDNISVESIDMDGYADAGVFAEGGVKDLLIGNVTVGGNVTNLANVNGTAYPRPLVDGSTTPIISGIVGAASITSGTLDGDRLPDISATKKGAVPATGTPSGKYLKDDGTWAAPGDVTAATNLADTAVVIGSGGVKGVKTISSLTVDSGGVLTSTKAATVGDAASSSAQLTVKGGASGGNILNLERTTGATVKWGVHFAGSFYNLIDNVAGLTGLGLFTSSGGTTLLLGNNAGTASTGRPSILDAEKGTGTDASGGALYLDGGLGTGAGNPGKVVFRTGTQLGAGLTTAHSLSNRWLMGLGLSYDGTDPGVGNIRAIQFTSTAPSGTPPLVVPAYASGATVTGLSADLLDGQHGSYYAPINAPAITGHPTIEGVTSTGATGTGKLVFDTSPALVNPTVGGGVYSQTTSTTIDTSAVSGASVSVSGAASLTITNVVSGRYFDFEVCSSGGGAISIATLTPTYVSGAPATIAAGKCSWFVGKGTGANTAKVAAIKENY